MTEFNTLFMNKMAKKPYHLGPDIPDIAHIRDYPPPPPPPPGFKISKC